LAAAAPRTGMVGWTADKRTQVTQQLEKNATNARSSDLLSWAAKEQGQDGWPGRTTATAMCEAQRKCSKAVLSSQAA